MKGEPIHGQCNCDSTIYMRELSHRTANIIQVAMAALSLSKRGRLQYVGEAIDQLKGAADLNSMLAHEENGIVGLGAHLMRVCAATGRSMGAGDEIDLHLDVPTLIVGAQDARCLAMIVSELVGNSIKHAFVDRRGSISVTVRDNGSLTAVMVEDDGVCRGWSRPDGKGRGIVDGLAERMGGRVRRIPTAGGSSRVQVLVPSIALVAGRPLGAS